MLPADVPVPRPAADDRFETLFEQAPFSVQLLSPAGRTLRVNRAWKELWSTADGDPLLDYVLGEYDILADAQLEEKGIVPLLRRAFAGESIDLPAIHYDPRELGKPGRARWVRASAHPVHDADGSLREVMLIHEDVTDRLGAEEALRTSARAARTAEEQLRVAVRAGRIGIWDWDIARNVVEWTDEVYALHGVPPGGFGGTVEAFAALVHPDDVGAMSALIQGAVERGDGFEADFRVVLPDGTPRWLTTWARVHREADGAPARMIGATLSVDAYKRAEAALREGDRRKDEFLAMLAHELRNPLAPIGSAAELLRRTAESGAGAAQAASIILRQLRHMTELVDDLLDVSRVTRGLIRLDTAVIDLGAVIDTAVEQTRPLLEARGHVLEVARPPAPVHVRGDDTRLVQSVANLLTNAAKYTPPGGRIWVALDMHHGLATLSVRDSGVGIDPGFLPHVFELFSQGARTPDRSIGGLGIGLALVRRIVELHGGRIEATSAGVGRGSMFSIALPTVPAPAGPTGAAPSTGSGAGTGPSPPPAPKRIVIVDDNVDASEALAALLELDGHAVTVHHAADSVLADVDAGVDADAWLLDIGLPGMDGYELARRLRGRRPHALLIALTGYGQPDDRERSREAGFDHHFLKPVEPEALARVLNGATPRPPARDDGRSG